jgi:putative ABC transport system permease protein
MKHLPLVWAGLWRKPSRTVFTMICIVIAFLLFGLLQGVDSAFSLLVQQQKLDRLFVDSRVPGQPLPLSYRAQIERIPGITRITEVAFLPGYYRTVVGVFESNGDSHESELFTDAETLLSAFQRNFITSVTVLLESPQRFADFAAALSTNPTLSVDVKRERDYFVAANRPTSRLLGIIAYAIGGIMAFGAAFAALNTMYSAVSARSAEIATLRAIGFGGAPVVVSVLVEALLLALIGAALGAAVAWYFFNGNAVSTVTGTSPSQVTFALNVDAGLIAAGMACACAIGVVGGLFPAIRAARLSVAAAMRGA